MDIYSFGYPEQCDRCKNLPYVKLKLPRPYHNNVTSTRKVMLIGQDPHIHRDPDRVECVLMLNQGNGQLARWLRDVLGEHGFNEVELYATNMVKCPVERESSTNARGVLSLLQSCFDHCRDYLVEEIESFRPTMVLTLGEPAHRMFFSVIDRNELVKGSMKEDFTGEFIQASVMAVAFQYSPCLHIKTYRIADTYGRQVERFRHNLQNSLWDELPDQHARQQREVMEYAG